MSSYARHVSTRETPQTEPIPGTSQIQNSAGGYCFPVDKWTRLERFLCLGCESGSYYATARKLTVENAGCIRECLAEDAARTIATIVAVSDGGRAPKNDPAIFALAMAAGSGHAAAARDALPRVCRIGTHLLMFVEAVKSLRGWGPALRAMVGGWYSGQDADALAFHVTKYAQRGGWSHRDVLRRCGPAAPTPAHDALYRWVAKGIDGLGAREVRCDYKFHDPKTGAARESHRVSSYPEIDPALLPKAVHAYEATKKATTKAEVIRLIREERIPREYLEGSHSEMLNDPGVWEALLESMPLTAMVRNLAKMTAVGLLTPLSAATSLVCARLADADYIRKSRLHPVAILLAAKTYASGHGLKGSLSWTPASAINDALDGAFYAAFVNVEPAGKRTLIALDVSGSMAGSMISGTSLSAREGAAALAMVTARTEPNHQIVAFSAPKGSDEIRRTPGGWSWTGGRMPSLGGMHGGGDAELEPLDISSCSRLTDVLAKTDAIPMGGTDCSLPMRAALAKGWQVDTFIVLTDNETWAGPIHPCQALRQYREKTGIPAKLVVIGMTATEFTVADPNDAGSLDVVGLDAAAPSVISDFSRGGPAGP